jgi:DNA-binding MarR family transcriptional regulator
MHEKLGKMVVWRRFSGVATFFLHAIDDFLQSNAKVSLKELQLLIQLRSGGGTLRMMDLASRLRITKAGITKMVGRLEQQDLV